jgi:metal-responsive CopG/Arc/MetJ family transcriptional regulator
MSKGSPIVPIRIPPLLLVQIDQIVDRSAHTRSSFIIAAIEEKLRHRERSNRQRSG